MGNRKYYHGNVLMWNKLPRLLRAGVWIANVWTLCIRCARTTTHTTAISLNFIATTRRRWSVRNWTCAQGAFGVWTCNGFCCSLLNVLDVSLVTNHTPERKCAVASLSRPFLLPTTIGQKPASAHVPMLDTGSYSMQCDPLLLAPMNRCADLPCDAAAIAFRYR